MSNIPDTMEVKERFKWKTKRKEHPSAPKYCGHPNQEFQAVLRKFMMELDSTQLDQMYDGKLILEEELTASVFDTLQVGDVVGLGLIKGIPEETYYTNPQKLSSTYRFKILDIDKSRDLVKARNVSFEVDIEKEKEEAAKRKRTLNIPDEVLTYKGAEVSLAFEDFSVGLATGFCEVLERDGKLFGVSEEIEHDVVILVPKKDEGNQVAAPAQLPENTEEKS